jgi:hypothetical protein
MKKQILAAIILVATVSLNAQVLNPANRSKAAMKLTKNTKTTSNTNTEMQGQAVAMRNDQAVTSTYEISATIPPQGATAEIRITAMKVEGEAMGQEMGYDSQNPDDGNAEMGAEVKKAMRNVIKLTLDENGFIIGVKGNEKLDVMGNNNTSLEKGNLLDVFFKIKKPVKVDDTWSDTSDTKEAKTINNYTYKSFENGLATIELVSQIKIDNKTEMMGMPMYSKQEGKVVATLLVDTKTLIIKKNTSTMVMSGTIEVRGQTSPVSVLTNTTETVE